MRVWNLSEDLANLTRQSLRARDRDNKESAFEGVALVESLRGGGVKFGPDLRGPDLALHLVDEASGGYRAVIALPEIGPACTTASSSWPTIGTASRSRPGKVRSGSSSRARSAILERNR